MTYKEKARLAAVIDSSPILGGACQDCGGPCLVPAWVVSAGGMNYANAPERQKMAISKAHRWLTPDRLRHVTSRRGSK